MKKFTIPLLSLVLSLPTANVSAQTFARFYSGNNGGGSTIGSRGSSSGSQFNQTFRGSRSGFVRNFGQVGGSGGLFGVPTGSSVGGATFISRPHRSAYLRQIRAARAEQNRLNNLPLPCGLYGRLPSHCEVKRFGSQ